MKNAELVFIPSPGVGHLVSAVETAKILIDRDERLSITVLVMKIPSDANLNAYTRSVSSNSSSSSDRLRFVDLPYDESKSNLISPHTFLSSLIDSHKLNVKNIAAEMVESDSSTTRLAGFVVDMFCVSMIDVANEFGVPSYVYFTCGAAMLGLMFHLQALRDDHNRDITEYKESDAELAVPSFVNPVPAKVLPSVVLDKEGGSTMFLNLARRFRETKGIIINTFLELEPYAIESLTNDDAIPTIYPVGPMLNLKGDNGENDEAKMILKWLDDQRLSSVVFLCFGSMGSFDEDQIKEIADALERSGHRFLWSLRRSPPKGKLALPSDYSNPEEVLPDGFLKRTAGTGKVIGWAPQVEVLSHPSVGGFVSHCGWNSTLESVWCGVPVATWPMYAEQQMNAFELVKELGMAVEIKMDYMKDFRTESSVIVTADVIENGLRQLMMDGNGDGELVRKKVKEASEKSRMAMSEGGSSYTSLGHLIEDIINIPQC